jgi:nucleotide-binding universal stress UspA family protein
VPYDGSRRAERTLAHAVELCRDANARLGLAVIWPRFLVFDSPWVCVAAPIQERDTCNDLLRRLPDDLSVTFLSWPHPAGVREIAEFARRLDCDSVLLAYSGRRARRAARILARSDVAVLLDADGVRPPRPRRRAIRPPSPQADPPALAMPVALVPIPPQRPNL